MPLIFKYYFDALRSYLNLAHYEAMEIDGGLIDMKDKIYQLSSQVSYFLDDSSKPRSERCDYAIFHSVREEGSIHCFEFRSASQVNSLVDKLGASEAWCHALYSTINHYISNATRLHLTKFVLSCHSGPTNYIDQREQYLQRDHTIRHSLYQGIDGLFLDALDNANVGTIG